MKYTVCALVLSLFYGVASSTVAADAVSQSKTKKSLIGTPFSSLALNDIRGSKWSLDDVKDKPVVVLAFLGTQCPLAQAYGPVLQKLAAELEPRGVAFVGINSNQQDSLSEIAHYAKTQGISFPLLKDAGNLVADQLGAERTPEVFVLDAERRVRYHGRIDDQFSYGVQRPKAEHSDLTQAIAALLEGKAIETPETNVVGCHIGRVLSAKPNSDVTYTKHISRIFNKRCVECHRDGQVAPFTLTNYQESVGWAEMISEVVREQRMPPWHANPEFGEFANDSRLTNEEKDLIFRWVKAGAPEGDPRDLPEPPQFVDGWRIGKPDMVYYMSEEPYNVPATGEVKYQYFTVDPGFKEDRWVKAAECHPGNRAVVHHIIVATGNRDRLATRLNDEVVSDWLSATAPGARPMILPTGLAKRIPAGSKLIFQVHYTPNGKAQQDRSSIGLVFADPDQVKHEIVTQKAANSRFRIPAGDANHQVEASYTVGQDAIMLAAFPHMHLRGKSFRYSATYPDGREEVLLDVPHYDFNWQNSYIFAEPKKMPAGTKINCVAHFDNSSENWANPDPKATVKWGDQTWEEMMIGYFDIMPVKEVSKATVAAVNRTADFVQRAKAGEIRPDPKLHELAQGAQGSTDKWSAYYKAVRQIVPQLDRADWITLSDNKLTVERAAQDIPVRRMGGEGTVIPAVNMLLAEHAAADASIVHEDLDKVTSADFQLMRRIFGSSVHIPVTLDGKRGIISFWSTDSKAFPPEAVKMLEQTVSDVAGGK